MKRIHLLTRDRLIGAEFTMDGGQGTQFASTLAMFHFWGMVRFPFTVNSIWVKLHQGSGATSVTAAEVGLFSSPVAPNGSGQTLTKLAAAACTNADLQAAGPAMFKNTSAMGYTVVPGTYLWLALRYACGGTLPSISSRENGPAVGHYLTLASAGALTGLSTAVGSLPATINAGMPGIYAATD